MRLFSAARLADTTDAYDAYNPLISFKVDYSPLSYAKIDGVAIKKRSVSTSPTATIPARGAITIDGQTYLIGYGAPDYWRGEKIRVTYVIQGAEGLAALTSISDALAGNPAVDAYAALVFNRYLPDSDTSGKYPPQYQIFTDGNESVPEDSLVSLEGKSFLVKESYLSNSGLRVALVNELDSPVVETATHNASVYDPITDARVETPTSVQSLRVKWQEHFNYLSKASETYERGDMQVFVLKSVVTPKPSDTLTLSDGVWRILAAQDEGLLWSLHVRRA